MSNQTPVFDAGQVLSTALCEKGSERQRAALDVLLQLFAMAFALSPKEILGGLARQEGESEPTGFSGVADLVRALTKGLNDKIHFRLHILLRLLQPKWMCGEEKFLSDAPPFAEVKEDLMAALDCGVIDFEGFAAVLIGRYGPEARDVLPELVDRLRNFRTDCSKAPGLTWAVYQIGGVSAPVRDVLIEVARGSDSCPHSRPIAQKVLAMNEIAWE